MVLQKKSPAGHCRRAVKEAPDDKRRETPTFLETANHQSPTEVDLVLESGQPQSTLGGFEVEKGVRVCGEEEEASEGSV